MVSLNLRSAQPSERRAGRASEGSGSRTSRKGRNRPIHLEVNDADHVFARLAALVKVSGLAALIATHNMDLAALIATHNASRSARGGSRRWVTSLSRRGSGPRH